MDLLQCRDIVYYLYFLSYIILRADESYQLIHLELDLYHFDGWSDLKLCNIIFSMDHTLLSK